MPSVVKKNYPILGVTTDFGEKTQYLFPTQTVSEWISTETSQRDMG